MFVKRLRIRRIPNSIPETMQVKYGKGMQQKQGKTEKFKNK